MAEPRSWTAPIAQPHLRGPHDHTPRPLKLEYSPSTRPGVVVQGTEPFNERSKQKLKWLLSTKIGGEEGIKNVGVSQDWLKLYVEFVEPKVIHLLLSEEIYDPVTKAPFSVEYINLLEVGPPCLVIRNFPPFVDEATLKSHFESLAGDQEIHSVSISHEAGEAQVMYAHAPAAFHVISKGTNLFGSELCLELRYLQSKPEDPLLEDLLIVDPVDSVLAVRGLPKEMMNNLPMLKAALKHYFKQTTEYDTATCEIEDGVGYLTFNENSAVESIATHPPTKEFWAGNVLQMSVVSKPTMPQGTGPVDSPPTIPKTAWNSPMEQGNIPTARGVMPAIIPSQQECEKPPIPPRTRNRSKTESPANGNRSPYFNRQHPPNAWGQRDMENGQSARPMAGQFNTDLSYGWNQMQGRPHGEFSSNSAMSRSSFAHPLRDQWTPHYQQDEHQFYMEESVNGTNFTDGKWGRPHDHRSATIMDFSSHPRKNLATSSDGLLLATDILVSNLPLDPGSSHSASALPYYFQSLIPQVEAKVKLYGSFGIVVFSQPIDLIKLGSLAQRKPFMNEFLALLCLEPSSTLLVSNIAKAIPHINLLKYYFESQVGDIGTQVTVRTLSQNQALLMFTSPYYVQMVLAKCPHELEHVQLQVEKYSSERVLQADEHLKLQEEETVCPVQHKQLSDEQYLCLEQSLTTLNKSLAQFEAQAEIEESNKSVSIKPLKGANKITDWERNVVAVLEKHFSEFHVERVFFCKEAKGEVLSHVLSAANDHQTPLLQIIEHNGESITIFGQKDMVANICLDVAKTSSLFDITTCSVSLPRRVANSIKTFWNVHLKQRLPDVKLDFISQENQITATANQDGHIKFKAMVEELEGKIHEKELLISSSAYQLLSSERGTSKLFEIFGTHAHLVVYDLYETTQADGTASYYLHLAAEDVDYCKKLRKEVKLYIHEQTIKTTNAKIRVCSSKEWRDMVTDLAAEHFVMITVGEVPLTITVTGEQLVCADIVSKIQTFLVKHTNTEERVTLTGNEWQVVSTNFKSEVEGVKTQAKQQNARVEWPEETIRVPTVSIVIQGEPDGVDNIKVMVEMLVSKVCKKESRVSGIPAVAQVIDSMADRINTIENMHKAAIEVYFDEEDGEDVEVKQTCGELPRKVCSATSPTGARVTIHIGDTSQHPHVDVIVNFITPDPNVGIGNLKLLFEAAGTEALEDFNRRVLQTLQLLPAEIFKTQRGKLKCTKLLHCVLPPWSSTLSDSEKMYHLEDGLRRAFQNTLPDGSILITPLTITPFHYPINLIVGQVAEVLTTVKGPDLQTAIYVEELHHAMMFEDILIAKKFQIHTKVPQLLDVKQDKQVASPTAVSVKTITSPLNSFVTLINGDMLEQQADVYINSTNTNLDLKQGNLSQLLLNACGNELQKECSEYAPLKPAHVAVTAAKNLKCRHIFHVALPNYKINTAVSVRLFRETIQKILRIGKDMSISSIAIPSLGVANLDYPASVSAQILFEEVISFHMRSPNSILKFIFVIYEKKVYQVFSKQFAKCMSDGIQTPQAPPSHGPPEAAKSPREKKSSVGPSTRLKIVYGNIADETTDVIVNTTTEDILLTRTAVSKAILERAGEQLQKTCTQLVTNGITLEHGQTVTTLACGSLRCRKIIHAHLPFKRATSSSSIDCDKFIEDIVDDCLSKAEGDRMESISFPAFGLGSGGYGVNEVASPMLKTFKRFGLSSPKHLKLIKVVIFDKDLYTLFRNFYCKFFNRDLTAPSPPSLLSRIFGFANNSDDDAQELQSSMSRGLPGIQPSDPYPVSTPHTITGPHTVTNSVVVFKIFAASDAVCTEVESKLRDSIKTKSVTRVVKDNDTVRHLIDADTEAVLQIGESLGVKVVIKSKINEITISGEKTKVLEAVVQVKQILSEVEKCKNELNIYEWQSEDDGGFEPYPPEASIKLERAYSKKLDTIQLIVEGVSVLIDLQEKIEISQMTGKRRDVIRVKRSKTVELPSTWMHDPLPQAGKKEDNFMFDVALGTPEYDKAVSEFKECLNKHNLKFSIEKVERVQNKLEFNKHLNFQDTIQEKYNKKPSVRRLFHGSKHESIHFIVAQGFNRNFAADENAAFFGKGVYFAVDAAYSAQEKYSKPDGSGLQYMFVCSVIVGKYTQGKQSMKVSPTLTPDTKEVFDSLVNDEKDPTIFVAMSDAQAYPEYLITFKIDRSKK